MIMTMPIHVGIVEMQPVKCTALPAGVHMQVLPAHLHRQQTETHKGNEKT